MKQVVKSLKVKSGSRKQFLICFPMKYREFSVKINSENTIFIFTVCKDNDRSSESNVPRSICPKTLCSLSPTLMLLHIKFDQDLPTGLRDIQVQTCEIVVTQGQVTPK